MGQFLFVFGTATCGLVAAVAVIGTVIATVVNMFKSGHGVAALAVTLFLIGLICSLVGTLLGGGH